MASVDEKQGHGRVLEFDKVTKSFAKTDSNEITHALAEVNLTIQPGLSVLLEQVDVENQRFCD